MSEVNPNPQILCIPLNYRGQKENLSNIGFISGYPNLSWSVDVYNVWLAQNSNLINLKMDNLKTNTIFNQVENLGQVAGSIPNVLSAKSFSDIGTAIEQAGSGTLNYARTNINYEYEINKQMAEMEKQAMLPDNANLSGNNTTIIRIWKI